MNNVDKSPESKTDNHDSKKGGFLGKPGTFSRKANVGCLIILPFVILMYVSIYLPGFIAYRKKTLCTQAESDANDVAIALADYFVDFNHTATPTFDQLKNWTSVTLSGKNTATITGADPNISLTITITDGSGKCPVYYQDASSGWDGNGVYTLTITNPQTQKEYNWRRTVETQAKNFYNKAMTYFSETGATSITIDNLPGFESDPNVTITGGPMQFDGGNVTFAVPMTFRHQATPIIYVLQADGTVLTKAEYELNKDIDRFVVNRNDIVWDKKTDLEWVAGPDKNTTWYEAKRWVENLNFAGSGWRMPTRAELKSLYQQGAGSRNMTPLLKTTGWRVWSDETKGSYSAWYFGFIGGYEYWDARGDLGRGFAVRSRR